MHNPQLRHKIEELLAVADIRINGNRPWDMQVHDERLYARVLTEGSLGLGEAYMDGWWDCECLDQFFTRVLKADLSSQVNLKRNGFPCSRPGS